MEQNVYALLHYCRSYLELYTAVLSIELVVAKCKENEINENLLDGSKFQKNNIKKISA